MQTFYVFCEHAWWSSSGVSFTGFSGQHLLSLLTNFTQLFPSPLLHTVVSILLIFHLFPFLQPNGEKQNWKLQSGNPAIEYEKREHGSSTMQKVTSIKISLEKLQDDCGPGADLWGDVLGRDGSETLQALGTRALQGIGCETLIFYSAQTGHYLLKTSYWSDPALFGCPHQNKNSLGSRHWWP